MKIFFLPRFASKNTFFIYFLLLKRRKKSFSASCEDPTIDEREWRWNLIYMCGAGGGSKRVKQDRELNPTKVKSRSQRVVEAATLVGEHKSELRCCCLIIFFTASFRHRCAAAVMNSTMFSQVICKRHSPGVKSKRFIWRFPTFNNKNKRKRFYFTS